MNGQWSCAGICVEPQSEQRSLGTNQQAASEVYNLSGTTGRTTPATFSVATTSATFHTACSSPTPASCSSSSSQPCLFSSISSSAFNSCPSISFPISSVDKVEEPGNSSCNYEPSSSIPAADNILSPNAETLKDVAYPCTSTADNIFDEKITLSDCQLSRFIRRRCKFLLSSSFSQKLLRIALKQPVSLKRLGITSVKVGDSDLIPITVNDAALNLLSLPYANTVSEMNTLAGMPVGVIATDRACVYDPYHSENRHELTPSTSTGHSPEKRKTGAFEGDLYQAPIGVHGHMGSVASVPPNMASELNSAKHQQPQTAPNTNSPLLVNLLRSSSPSANSGIHNLQHSHIQRPSATPVLQHISAPPPQTQGTAGYPSYPYMGQGTVLQPGRMRPSTVPVDASHLTTSAQSHSAEQQQQLRSMAQEVNMERHQQVVAPQQQGAPAQQQLPQTYYPPQYNQRRPMLPGFAVRGQIPQQQPTVYTHQQGQVMRPQFIHVQQQPRLSGHAMTVQFHQTVAVEQEAGSIGASAPAGAAAPPPPKKRKRPTKKQLKEAEMAQQAAVAAAAQQQQQYMMEQQMNSRVPSANAHTVDRPAIMSQAIHSGQTNIGMAYAQHPQGYPPQTLRSPPGVSAQTGPMMQSPSSNPSYYQQQQHMWVPQHQQQMIQQQRPQMIYAGQMQHHWQNNQPHHPRMMYPQADNVSDLSAGSSGSVHTSPMTSRNASVDYSPASQSSSTMSPLYQQQQPNMVYQQQPPNQQTPSSALNYPQPSPSQQVGISSRPQQQQQQATMPVHLQHRQQQPVVYSAEQQQHCVDIQPKSCLPVMQGGGDFEIDEGLGANIADDCGDYNDLDSIEPMTESGDVGATLMASHQQQMQQQQQQQYYNRMIPPHNRYEIQSQMPQQNVAYMRQMCNEAQVRQCGFSSSLGPSAQQQPSYAQGYASPQQHLQSGPPQGATNMFMSPPSVQPNCSPSPYTPHSSPQKDGNNYVARQQQRHIIAAPQQHQSQYSAPSLSQQQQQPQSVRTPLSAPPTVHTPQMHPSCARTDDSQSSRSDGEVTPRTLGMDSSSSSFADCDKDPINSTIDAVVMRALSDQDSLSTTNNPNYFRGPRSRLLPSTQQSPTEQIGTNDNARPTNAMKQAGQFYNSQQTQQFPNTTEGMTEGGEKGLLGTHNGKSATISTLHPAKTPVSVPQIGSTSRGNFHGVTYGGCCDVNNLSMPNKQKDLKSVDKICDQRSNNMMEQHHFANGHESMSVLKERGFAQPCNGMLPLSQTNDDDRRTAGGATQPDAQQLHRSSPKTVNVTRRNRRKADLSLEASPHADEDEITVSTFASYPAPYVRCVGGSGGIVVGCSGSAPAQPPFANISVQSAQNNFSATVARQQQMLKQQPKTS